MPPKAADDRDPFEHFIKCQNSHQSRSKLTHEVTAYDDIRKKERGHTSHHWHYCMLPCIKNTKWASKKSKFELKDVEAAKAYVRHPLLGKRLGYLAALLVKGSSQKLNPANMNVETLMLRKGSGTWEEYPGLPVGRLWGCMTLFDHVLSHLRLERNKEARNVCDLVLDKYFKRKKEPHTEKYLVTNPTPPEPGPFSDPEPDWLDNDDDHDGDDDDDGGENRNANRNANLGGFQLDGAGDNDDDGGGGGGGENQNANLGSSQLDGAGDDEDTGAKGTDRGAKGGRRKRKDANQDAEPGASQLEGTGETRQDDDGDVGDDSGVRRPDGVGRSGRRTRKRRRRS
ncbi:hypothetical protein B0T21DRAFT_364598 [Apiosordaria backusii]|uniref:Uncharacterized protein n=1 Tax=Apiosordaria backusii TaxID=314023 RepID=A0AA40BMW3_9PEZI|nr:hypothetical protein B0T21DRAFT_364598 [Apiosordaria backusii]